MISVLASTTVGSRDADEEPTGMYSRRVVEVSTEVRSCTMVIANHYHKTCLLYSLFGAVYHCTGLINQYIPIQLPHSVIVAGANRHHVFAVVDIQQSHRADIDAQVANTAGYFRQHAGFVFGLE